MIETYVSIGEVTDCAIGVLRCFAAAGSVLLFSIIGALAAWMFWSAVGMVVAIVGMVMATLCIGLGVFELHTQKRRRR